MPETDISIVIVNYNVKDFLYQCLSSIERASSGLNVETIVVDNNSVDGSVQYLAPLFPNVRFIALESNLGFGRANNIGFEHAHGKYILILNPDTILSEETLHVMKEFMDSAPDVAISGCKVLNADGTFQPACRRGFPSPWASFCKLFGLQKMFPRSKVFAKYNQTFRSTDETYEIDAVIGAFMFCRADFVKKVNGFDTEYFMYGEDIDLCWAAYEEGYKVVYLHTTSIIHYKGESTRRSSTNDVKHLYSAMQIFVRKHYGRSFIFLALLQMAIFFRRGISYLIRYYKDLGMIVFDQLALASSIMLSTKIRHGGFLNIPDFAMPTVFVVTGVVLFFSMLFAGEYFESKPKVRKAVFGLMISFFVFSSLPYYFKDYEFSRSVLMMTIAFTAVFTSLFRVVLGFAVKLRGREKDRRIAIVGLNEHTESIISRLGSSDRLNANLAGVLTVAPQNVSSFAGLPVIGNWGNLKNIIRDYFIDEVIVTDTTIEKTELFRTIADLSDPNIKIHPAQDYEQVVTSRIIDKVTGHEPQISTYKAGGFRVRFAKRVIDIVASALLLTVLVPLAYFVFGKDRHWFKKIWLVFAGKMSFVGLYPKGKKFDFGKEGIIGLAHISRPDRLSDDAISNLNEYYLLNTGLELDTDIWIKFLFRRKFDNHTSR